GEGGEERVVRDRGSGLGAAEAAAHMSFDTRHGPAIEAAEGETPQVFGPWMIGGHHCHDLPARRVVVRGHPSRHGGERTNRPILSRLFKIPRPGPPPSPATA